MENFFVDDNFYSDISELVDDVLYDERIEDVSELPDDWEIECKYTEEKPIGQFDKEKLVGQILETCEVVWSDMLPEDDHRTLKELKKSISAGIDVEKMNPLVPTLYYPTREKFKITKKDLIENS